MAKKTFVPMHFDVQEFKLNEAVAACTKHVFNNVADMLCDDCGIKHWKVFHNGNFTLSSRERVTKWQPGALAVNVGFTGLGVGNRSHSCENAGLVSGEIVYTAANYGDTSCLGDSNPYFEPFPDNTAGSEVPNFFEGDVDQGTGSFDPITGTIVTGATS